MRKQKLTWLFAFGLSAWVALPLPASADDNADKPAAESPDKADTTDKPTKPGGANPFASVKKNPFANVKDPFVGVFANPQFQIEADIQGAGGKFQGTLKLQGNTYPFTAARQDDDLAGKFKVGEEQFPFSASLQDDVLTLKTSGQTFALKRKGGKPATGTPGAGRPGGATKPPDLGAILGVPSRPGGDAGKPPVGTAIKRSDLRVGSHPSGFKFRYPEAWRFGYSRDAVVLQPLDTERDLNGNPYETFLIHVVDPRDSTTAGDEAMIKGFDQQMQRSFPYFKRKGEVGSFDTLLGPGAVLNYEGVYPEGTQGRAIVYAAHHGDKVVYLVQVGRVDLVTRRQPLARQVFASFGWADGQADAGLVGTWGRTDAAGRKLVWRFSRDGKCELVAAGQAARKGEWTVINKKLFVAWADGSAGVVQFEVASGVTLSVRSAGSEPIVWKKQ